MADYREAFIGIDVAKLRNAIAIADAGRDGEVRFFGEVDASNSGMRHVVQRISAKFDRRTSATRQGRRDTGSIGSSARLVTSARWRRRH